MLYKTQGIIIKKQNFGENDRLLTIYTKDFGKILVKAKAVRKNQAKLKGHLETFYYSYLIIAPARGWDIVTSAETIDSFPYLRQNLSCLAAAHYLSELTDKLMAGPEKDADIWQLLLHSFKQLDQEEEIKRIINNFENSLVNFLGYGEVLIDSLFTKPIKKDIIK